MDKLGSIAVPFRRHVRTRRCKHSVLNEATHKIVAAVRLGSSYDTIPKQARLFKQLQVFDVVIGGSLLEKLCRQLVSSQILVNREGYQVKYRNGDDNVDLHMTDSHMSTLNNMFGWGKYGVEPTITTVWNRYDVSRGKVVINY
ncbi:hypothetical protein LINPERPRIM_LOCUS12919 [Linum perenne]